MDHNQHNCGLTNPVPHDAAWCLYFSTLGTRGVVSTTQARRAEAEADEGSDG